MCPCFQALEEHEQRAKEELLARQANDRDRLEEAVAAEMAELERQQKAQLETNKQKALNEREQRLAAVLAARGGDMTEEERRQVR